MSKIQSSFEREQRLAIGFGCQSSSNAEQLLTLLNDKDFINPIYADIVNAIEKTLLGYTEVSAMSVGEHLDENVSTDYQLMLFMSDYAESGEDIKTIARVLKDNTLRRYLHKLNETLGNNIWDSNKRAIDQIIELQTWVGYLEKKAGAVTFNPTDSTSIVTSALEYLNTIKSNKQLSIPTGIKHFEDKLRWGGLACGELTVLGSVRSIGKTAFGLQILQGCGQADIPALYINLESTNESLFYRMALKWTDGELLNPKSANSETYNAKLKTFSDWFKTKQLFIEKNIKDVHELRIFIKRLVNKYGLKCVVIDYANKLQNSKAVKEQRYRHLTLTYETLQEIAIDHNISVLALHQLGQKAEDENYTPTLSDMKESGGVSDVADTVILLWGNREAQDINCKIAKQKNYKIFPKFTLRYDRQLQTMSNGLDLSTTQSVKPVF